MRMDGDLLVAELTGNVTAQELLEFGSELSAFERQYPVTPDRLTDISGIANISFDYESIQTFARLRNDSPPANPIKSAVYAPTHAQFGMARIFQALSNHPAITVEIFRDRTAALAWLSGFDTPIR